MNIIKKVSTYSPNTIGRFGGNLLNGLYIEYNGTKKYYLNDKLHREDGPAVEYTDGTFTWYLHGEYHRVGGPAMVRNDGGIFYYQNNLLHREDGPACILSNGEELWYLRGTKIQVKNNKEFLRLLNLKVFW